MFDTRAAIPIISSIFIQQYSLPTINQDIPLRINGTDGCAMPGEGEAFTYSLMLEYKQHFTRETFEVIALDGEIDMILPYWWMVQHQPNTFWGRPKVIVLDPEFCKGHYTKAAAQECSLSLDKEILHNYDATIISYITSITRDMAEIDPATIIPEKVQQYCKVLGKELADKLLDHKPYNHAIDLKLGE
jgi:hypothetical protein